MLLLWVRSLSLSRRVLERGWHTRGAAPVASLLQLNDGRLASLCTLGSENYHIWDFAVEKRGVVTPALQIHLEMFLTC